jgi:hypothetical protein
MSCWAAKTLILNNEQTSLPEVEKADEKRTVIQTKED